MRGEGGVKDGRGKIARTSLYAREGSAHVTTLLIAIQRVGARGGRVASGA